MSERSVLLNRSAAFHALDMHSPAPSQAWTNGTDRFVICGRLSDDTGWFVSRGEPRLFTVLDEHLGGYGLDVRQPDVAP